MGVKGEELDVSASDGLCLLDGGVNGMRPPAVRVEKRPVWLLVGVEIAAEAILCVCGRLDN